MPYYIYKSYMFTMTSAFVAFHHIYLLLFHVTKICSFKYLEQKTVLSSSWNSAVFFSSSSLKTNELQQICANDTKQTWYDLTVLKIAQGSENETWLIEVIQLKSEQKQNILATRKWIVSSISRDIIKSIIKLTIT